MSELEAKTIDQAYDQKLIDEICQDVETFHNQMVHKYNQKHLDMTNVTLHMMSIIFSGSVLQQYKTHGEEGIKAFLINHNSIGAFFERRGVGVEIVPSKEELS